MLFTKKGQLNPSSWRWQHTTSLMLHVPHFHNVDWHSQWILWCAGFHSGILEELAPGQLDEWLIDRPAFVPRTSSPSLGFAGNSLITWVRPIQFGEPEGIPDLKSPIMVLASPNPVPGRDLIKASELFKRGPILVRHQRLEWMTYHNVKF